MKKLLTLLVLCAASCSPLPAQNTIAGNLTVQQALKLTGSASPAQLTANANDYAPAGFASAAVLRLESDVPRTITGLAGGAAGRMVWLTNVGSQTISLATESSASSAANRFAFGASGFDLPAGGSLSIWYDTTSSRWRSATNLAAGGGGTTVDQTARDAAAAAQATADSKQPALANAATLAKVTESAGLPLWDGAAWPGGGSGGTGTVTNVSVVSANGVSGSVANASTTPAITLALGAIAPTSVAATGTVTGSNLSGTNTGDQTNVSGNAGTATKLATARAINGVSFDGTANITVPAAAGTLTGSTLASGVTASSLTSAAGGTFGTAAFTAATAYDPAGAAAAITLAGLGGVPTTRTVNGHALSGNVAVTPADLSLVIGTNTQAWSAKLDTVAALAAATGWLHNDGVGVLAWSTPSKSDVGLSNVENTALSTWAGTSNVTTLGTVTTGTWNAAAIADSYISSAATWNAKVSFPGFGTTETTACVGNDSRLSDARTPLAHTQAWSTITSTPTTWSGYGITDAQPLDAGLTALAGLSTTGLVARTGTGTSATRTITGTANQITVTNGDGVAGNPTLSLPQDIATSSTPQFAKIGVGGAADATIPVRIYTSGGNADAISVLSTAASGSGSSAHFRLAVDDGSAMSSGDRLGAIFFGGNDSATQYNSALIAAYVTENWTTNSRPSRLEFSTTSAANSRAVRLSILDSGNVGIGTNTPSAQLHVAGNVRFSNYGAGTLVTDSSGNITASSDASLKTVTGSFTRGLADVIKLTPRTYHWNEKSGMDTEDENVGFIAQEVLEFIPEAVGQYRTSEVEVDGKKIKKREKAELLTLSDRPLIAALVNAVRELNERNTALEARVAALENGKASK